jgi:hypothetical protein
LLFNESKRRTFFDTVRARRGRGWQGGTAESEGIAESKGDAPCLDYLAVSPAPL